MIWISPVASEESSLLSSKIVIVVDCSFQRFLFPFITMSVSNIFDIYVVLVYTGSLMPSKSSLSVKCLRKNKLKFDSCKRKYPCNLNKTTKSNVWRGFNCYETKWNLKKFCTEFVKREIVWMVIVIVKSDAK